MKNGPTLFKTAEIVESFKLVEKYCHQKEKLSLGNILFPGIGTEKPKIYFLGLPFKPHNHQQAASLSQYN